MAGLAAALNAPGCIDALRVALAPRGTDDALTRLIGPDGVILELAVRSAMPAIARVVGESESAEPLVVAALAVDGVASPSALDGRYVQDGAPGLIGGPDPYALVLADAERNVLVLARNGDGPGLYYARRGDGWLVASEPVALLRAGIPAEPDLAVIRDFVHDGTCDADAHTFLAPVSRVRPGEVVVLSIGGGVDAISVDPPTRPASVSTALKAAVGDGRIGVLLAPGLAGAAVLGAALSRPGRRRPLPVHTVSFPDLASRAEELPGALVPLGPGTVAPVGHTVTGRDLDLDGFLTDLGEPVPDLDLYLLWAIGRLLGDDVDTLVDCADGHPGSVARVCDRVSTRYGVMIRSPLRGFDPHLGQAIESIVEATLPAATRYAAQDAPSALTAANVLRARPDDVAAALARPRVWHDRAISMEALRRVLAGEPADAEVLLRAYLVERWLALLPALATPTFDSSSTVDSREFVAEPGRGENIVVAGTVWSRLPVPMEPIVAGDPIAGLVGSQVTDALAELSRDVLRGPWFVVLSGKALAVAQHRVCPLWQIEPGRSAHRLSGWARRRLPRLASPWTMQVALDDAGRVRVGAAVLLGRFGAGWAERLLPAAAANIFPPRPDAVAPADSCVVRAPLAPDEAASALIDALYLVAPAELMATLAGAAVVCADETGSRLLGFAPGPYPGEVPDPEAVVALLCLDNPAGQTDQLTPVVLAYHAPQAQPSHQDGPHGGPDHPGRSAAGIAEPTPTH
jgi:hypothetical protein